MVYDIPDAWCGADMRKIGFNIQPDAEDEKDKPKKEELDELVVEYLDVFSNTFRPCDDESEAVFKLTRYPEGNICILLCKCVAEEIVAGAQEEGLYFRPSARWFRHSYTMAVQRKNGEDMISEGVIKQTFVKKIFERDRKYIRDVQTQVVRENFRVVTGRLLNYVSHKSHTIEFGDGSVKWWFRVLPYVRFIDINFSNDYYRRKELKRKLSLYNRVVYGRLYNETQMDLEIGVTEEIRKQILEELSDTQS